MTLYDQIDFSKYRQTMEKKIYNSIENEFFDIVPTNRSANKNWHHMMFFFIPNKCVNKFFCGLSPSRNIPVFPNKQDTLYVIELVRFRRTLVRSFHVNS